MVFRLPRSGPHRGEAVCYALHRGGVAGGAVTQGTLALGQEVEVLQEAVDAAGTRRAQVRTDSGAVGWVRMAQLQPAYE